MTIVLAVSLSIPSTAFADDNSSSNDFWSDPIGTIASFFGVSTRNDEGSTTGAWQSDSDSHEQWYSGDQGVATQGGDSTKNTGRVWTDKSVYTGDSLQLTNASGEPTFAIENDEGTALIGLSALSSAADITGKTTINQPLDIVLVLDRSGSMSQYMEYYEYNETYSIKESDGTNSGGFYYQTSWGGTYYALVDGEYIQIQENTKQISGGWGSLGSYQQHVNWTLNGQVVEPKTSADDNDPNHIQFYEQTTNQGGQKSTAMEMAVNNFLDRVATENSGKDEIDQHRVSIVTYAENASQYSYGNSWNREYFTYCTEGDNLSNLKNYVDNINYNGGTQADDGMSRAEAIMNGTVDHGDDYGDGARENAKKIVIFFTDGMPGGGQYVENNVAGPAVTTAHSLKQEGATIYSVGIFSGADPSDLSGEGNTTHDANYFMNAVSSNYPDATMTSTSGNRDFSQSCELGERVAEDQNYYFAASDSDSLNNVFQTIYDDLGTGATSPITSSETIGGDVEGYLTFTDTLGDYMEVKNFKSIVFAGEKFTEVSSTDEGDTTTTYTFTGSVDNDPDSVYPGSHDLSTILISVQHGATLEDGDVVTVQIPESLLPLRLYTADINTVDGETQVTTGVNDAYPIRVYYTVGLKNDVLADDGTLDASEISADYIANHVDENGNVSFYSNKYEEGANGTTQATFTPATDNSFYYFTEDTPIYASESTDNPARSYNVGNTYYYQRTYYVNNAVQTEWVSFTAQEGQFNNYVFYDNDANSYYIQAGSPRLTRAAEFVAQKTDNTTETASTVISPVWGGSGEVVVSLGNNGKISYPVSGSLRIDKTVDWGTTGVTHNDQEFTYTVDLGAAGETVAGTFNYVKYDSEGQPLTADGTVQEVQEGAEPAPTGTVQDGGSITLTNDQYAIIDGLPANTAFTVTETAAAGYTAANTVDGTASDDGSVATGTIASNSTANVSYTNTYSVKSVELAANSITGNKTLNGRDWAQNEAFTFVIEEAQDNPDNTPLPDQSRIELTNDGYKEGQPVDFGFGSMTYESAGTYTYVVREIAPDTAAAGMNYSRARYIVTVTVTDDGAGNLQTPTVSMVQSYNDSGASNDPQPSASTAAFVNTFTGEGTATAQISGTKNYTDLTGSNPLDEVGMFQFAITPVDGAPGNAETVNVGVNGTFNSTDNLGLVFDIDDVGKTYQYEIKEVVPGGVTEQSPTLAGMTYDIHTEIATITVTQAADSGDIQATVSYDDDGCVFSNTYQASSVTTDNTDADSELRITKKLDGAAGAAEQFTFTMAAANDDTRTAIARGWVTGVGFAAENDETDETELVTSYEVKSPAIEKDGSAVILLNNITFNHPGTYTFNVNETSVAPNTAWSYDNHTYSITYVVSDQDGALQIDSVTPTGFVTFTNTYTASMDYDNEAGGIIFSKTLNGHSLAAQQFNFTVTGADPDSQAKLATVTLGTTNQQGADDGVATSWRGISGLTFDQDDVGKTFTFTVSETNGDAAGYTYDNQPVTVAIEVFDDGDGTLSTTTTVTKDGSATEYKSEDFESGNAATYPTAVFVNSYDHGEVTLGEGTDNALQIQKTVTGAPSNVDFSFTAMFDADASVKAAGSGLAGKLDGIKGASDSFTATAAITEDFAEGTDAKTASFDDITFTEPGTYMFAVTEDNADSEVPSGWTYDGSTKYIKVVVTDTNEGSLQAAPTYYNNVEGAVGADTTVQTAAAFTNSYKADPVDIGGDSGNAGIQVQKTLTGRDWQTGDTFTFTLTAQDNAPMPADAVEGSKSVTITNETDKTLDFGQITYDTEGTYTYKVKETVPTEGVLGGITYDSHEVTVTVTVTDTDHDGKLDVPTVSYNNSEVGTTEADKSLTNAAAFTNTYGTVPGTEEKVDTEATFGLTKQLTGIDWGDREFTFSITPTGETPAPVDSEGNEITQVTVSAPSDGDTANIDFGTFAYDKTGTYTYTIKEVVPEGATGNVYNGIAYDTHEVTVTVNITDDLAGGFVHSVQITNGDTKFTNTYGTELNYNAAGGLQIEKTLIDHAIADDQFEFTITAQNDASKALLGNQDFKVLQTKASTNLDEGNGVVTLQVFDDVVFTHTHDKGDAPEYEFIIFENKGGDTNAGYTNDKTQYTVTINVEDDGAGLLEVITHVVGGDMDQTYTSTNQGQQQTAIVPFTNTYEAMGTLGGEGAAKINATKTTTGRDMVAGEYNFTVTATNDNNEVKEYATGTNVAAADGVAGAVNFSAINYTKTSLNDDVQAGYADYDFIDGKDTYTYVYTVAEDTNGLASEGVTATASSFQITVVVTDNNDGTLSAQVAQYPDGSNSALAFANIYNTNSVDMTFVGAKQIDNGGWTDAPTLAQIAGEYTFTLSGVEEGTDNPAPLPADPTATNDATGNITFDPITYTLDNVFGAAETTDNETTEGAEGEVTEDEAVVNESTAEEGVEAETTNENESIETYAGGERSKTFTYTIEESGSVDGIQNDSAKTFTVTVTDDGSGKLTVDADQGTGALFTFTNTYNVPEESSSPTDGSLTLNKVLTGRDMAEGEFSFVITGTSENAQGMSATGTNTAAVDGEAGSVTLSAITFQEPGTYEFQISEVNGNLGGVDYDSATLKAVAEVSSDGKGKMEIDWTIYNADGTEISDYTYNNTYTASPTSVILGGTKVLDGRTLADGEFNFELRDADGNVLQTVANNAEGGIVFDKITYDAEGTYEYTISEVAGDAEGITYDDTTYTAKVVVTDDGQGSFKVSQLTYNDGVEFPLFTNTYTEPSAGGESDEGPIEYLTKTSDTWLPYFLGIIAAAAAAVVGISLRKIQSAHAAPRGRHGR